MGERFYYVERLTDSRILGRRVESLSPLRLGSPRVVFALPFTLGQAYYFQPRAFAVAPDGSRVLVVQPDQRRPEEIRELHVIRNWATDVKAKLAAVK